MYSWSTVDSDAEIVKISTWRSRVFRLAVHIPLIDGVLFDSGFPRARTDLELALNGKRVEKIANTHAHEDHLGNNAWLAATRKLELFASAASAKLAATRPTLPWYRNFIWGTPESCTTRILTDEFRTNRFCFRVVPIPGHIADMVAFHEPERGWVIGGDLFLGERMRVGGDWENGNAWIASLERIVALEPKIYFCYHLGAIPSPRGTFLRKLEFLSSLRDRIRELSRQGLSTAEISQEILGKEDKVLRFLSAGEFSKENLVRSFLK